MTFQEIALYLSQKKSIPLQKRHTEYRRLVAQGSARRTGKVDRSIMESQLRVFRQECGVFVC
jgi:hypothetical protein